MSPKNTSLKYLTRENHREEEYSRNLLRMESCMISSASRGPAPNFIGPGNPTKETKTEERKTQILERERERERGRLQNYTPPET